MCRVFFVPDLQFVRINPANSVSVNLRNARHCAQFRVHRTLNSQNCAISATLFKIIQFTGDFELQKGNLPVFVVTQGDGP